MEKLLEILPFKLWLILLGLLIFRYVLVAGIPYFWLYVIGRNKYTAIKIQRSYPGSIQVFNEVKYSLLTLFIYSSGIWLFIFWLQNGYTKNYSEINEFGIPYLILSVLLMIVIHDAYSYWIHRLMHHKYLFKYTHLLHHKFKNPSPWCAFAFHPFESILTLGIIPLIMFLIPWHNIALMIFITIIILYDTFIHLGFNLKRLKIFKWQNTPKDHDVHHRNSKYNFGLYFTFWDRLMGTYLNNQKS
ncbi:sterol desaturase family protein [Seonamhaeicola maritimus]|uniref:sterol desaturase family protein n=1 Tax=Seonamhaeicola maritimus TaxID=2591822 RepID=UPI002493F6D1|nr:sterol desaturase family protein [Seonamhaeicola maritimus]